MSYFGTARPYTITGDGSVVTGKGRLMGASLTHTAATTAILYDHASAASGTKLLTLGCAANDNGSPFLPIEGVEFLLGVYADYNAGTLTLYIAQ